MDSEVEFVRLERRLGRERRARLEAERIAEAATRELYETIQNLRKTSAFIAMLQTVAVAANEATSFEEAARVALGQVCQYTGWPIGHLYVTSEPGLLHPSGVWYFDDPARCLVFREVTEKTDLYSGEGLPGRVLASGRPAWIPDVTEDDNFPRALHAVDIGVRAGFGFPVLVGAEVVGVLEFFTTQPVEPNQPLLELMTNIGTQLGRVVERARSATALRTSEERTRSIIETANDAFVSMDTTGRITEWNNQAERQFGWTRDEAIGLLLTETIIPPVHREAHSSGVARFLATGEGPVLGRRVELEAQRRDGHQFPIELTPWAVPDGDGLRFHAFIHDITERKAFERQLEDQSLHDSLTGLANRVLFLDRLRQALARSARDGSRLATLFIDLDRFKAVNDSLGHDAGDRLLLAVADRIGGVLRPPDTLARLGGDEFVALCEGIESPEAATAIARRILNCLASPFLLGGSEVFASASVGIAFARPGDADPNQLLGDADLAMYRAKERGNSHELFDEDMRSRAVERLSTERALRHGIGEGELIALYQPVFELKEGAVVGLEALVRWRHPDRGLLGPAEFIPLAEETGLVGRIGEWMLRTACRQVRQWRDRHPDSPDIWMAVNLSVRELEQPRLLDDLVDLLATYALAPETLLLEVTESVLMHDARGVIRRLWELKELGVRLALDDFGTGYSSLDRLRRMPVEALKIDRSFIEDMNRTPGGTSLVAAVIAMSHSLGLGVVAEGVETPDQLRTLRRLRCDQFQGFLAAPPLPADEAERFLVHGAAEVFVHLPNAEMESLAVLETEVYRLVSRSLSDRLDIVRTTRSLLTELQRLIEPSLTHPS